MLNDFDPTMYMDSDESKVSILNKCIPFLTHIGIPTVFRKIEGDSFLPGLLIENGVLIIDETALLYPGDILHEAGHIAVMPASARPSLNAQALVDSKNREAEEMMAIAWSYAACLQIDLDPKYVFHEAGYRGGSDGIVENFNAGRYVGTAMLHWCNMAFEPAHTPKGQLPYPTMTNWLRA